MVGVRKQRGLEWGVEAETGLFRCPFRNQKKIILEASTTRT